MKYKMKILLTICLIVLGSKFKSVNATESITLEPSEATLLTTTTIIPQDIKLEKATDEIEKVEVKAEQRSIDFHSNLDSPTSNEDRHAAFRKRAKPLKSIFMGIYKNYKSTYMGNKTLAEYRNAMRLRKEKEGEEKEKEKEKEEEESNNTVTEIETTETYPANLEESKETEALTEQEIHNETATKSAILLNAEEKQKPLNHKNLHGKSRNSKKKRKKERLRNQNDRRTKKGTNKSQSSIYRYDFGHGYNMSLDMSNDIVKLNLDGESLKDLMQGRFFKDESKGRGKKSEMITRVLPLFIIPFLIQSAVVPFLVTKLKLLLMKSILVGKLAIFLLVLSAIKNSNKMMQTYEVAPSFWAGEPSRRSELAAAASAAAYNGYRVEGKPAAWIN